MADILARAGYLIGQLDISGAFPANEIRHSLMLYLEDLRGRPVGRSRRRLQRNSQWDRLFDVMMRRFDALTPKRSGLIRISRDLQKPPRRRRLPRPAPSERFLVTQMLEAAGIPSDGIVVHAPVQGAAGDRFDGIQVWLTDDSADLSRTMAWAGRQAASGGASLPAAPPGAQGR